jgi:hypothetical protein
MQSEQISDFPVTIKPVYLTIIYYIIVIPWFLFANTQPGFKSGPCNPGLDLVFGVLLFFGSIGLALVNLLLTKLRGKKYLPSALIHLGVFIAALLISLIFG